MTHSNPRETTLLVTSCLALQRAYCLAIEAHFGQLDKAGEPYLWHVLRVGFSLLPDVDAARLGILHDVLEDAGEIDTSCLLLALNGDEELYQDLLALTRGASESYEDYIQRVKARPRAAIVKLADLDDNLNLGRYELAIARGAEPVFMAALRGRYITARARLLS
jgi:(p)ppGpp synthase/HD superfamily hydrolase